MLQPETRFKRAFDKAFAKLFPQEDSYKTAIEKGMGQKSGLPDRFYTASGAHCWAEFKVHPNRLSRIQEHTCRKLSRSGTRVVVVTLVPPERVEVVQFNRQGAPCPAVVFDLGDVSARPIWNLMLRRTSQCCSL